MLIKNHINLVLTALLLVGCASSTTIEKANSSSNSEALDAEGTTSRNHVFDHTPLRSPRQQNDESDPSSKETQQSDIAQVDSGFTVTDTPKVTLGSNVAGLDDIGDFPASQGEFTLNLNDLPLPLFINKVFGDLLGLAFSIDPSLKNQQDLVTLRLPQEVTKKELYRISRAVLSDYGVALIEDQGLYRFIASKDTKDGDVPLLVSGRALPEVPASHRPIFQLVQLTSVRNTGVVRWLKEALKGRRLEVFEDPNRNAVWLKGNREDVKYALDVLEVLDQPLLKGRYSQSFKPTFLSASELASDLEKVLKSEGYEVSQSPPYGAILLVVLESTNQLVVFAADKQVLLHVREWAEALDSQSESQIDNGLFFYKVQSTQAESLAEVLQALDVVSVEGSGSDNSAKVSSRLPVDDTQQEPSLVVEKNLNMLVYRGSGESWSNILEILKELDKPAPQVLIEVIVAEVTRNDDKQTGVAWALNNIGIDDLDGVLSFGNLATRGTTNLVLDSAGETRAVLRALYANDLAVIRSSPRVMVKSGETANIDVGTEIPIITSQNTGLDNVVGAVNQEISYRKTGVLLNVEPVVQGDGVVQIKIKQELSQEAENQSADIGSPSIFTRSIETVLSLNDGGSVLMGGLISSNYTDGTGKVPLLGDIPLLGNLFRTDGKTEATTELMIMIVPYIITDGREAVSISDEFKRRLSQFEE
jgi:general secretion pathway protein D